MDFSYCTTARIQTSLTSKNSTNSNNNLKCAWHQNHHLCSNNACKCQEEQLKPQAKTLVGDS